MLIIVYYIRTRKKSINNGTNASDNIRQAARANRKNQWHVMRSLWYSTYINSRRFSIQVCTLLKGDFEIMKNNVIKRFRLMIPVLILMCAFFTMSASSHASAGTVRISKSKVNLYTDGGRSNIKLKILDDNNPVQAHWSSSKKKIATVSSTGKVKAKRTGTTTIYGTYAGFTYKCKVTVRKTSGKYKKCIKAYNRFLMNPYVLYTDNGRRAQADNFCTVDLDNNGIPELLVNVVTSEGRYHVIYRYKKGKMTTGQQLGICSDFMWYPSKRVMNFIKYEANQSLVIYSRDNGTTLNSIAILRRQRNRDRYYESDGSIKNYGERVSAVEFRNYVDHDILNYTTPKAVTMHVNTPYNRSRFLK